MFRTAMVIDDSEVDRYLAKRIIKKTGIADTVVEHSSGEQALQLLMDRQQRQEQCGPCPPALLVLLDINMPGMSGFDFLEQLESFIDNKGMEEQCVVVALYTSSSDRRDTERAEKHRIVVDYLVKPLKEERLRQLLS